MNDSFQPGAARPTRIGDYIIRELIAEGGMAQVYAAEEALSKRRVAVKILRTELIHSDQDRRQFFSEIKILTSLNHANIVRCLACTEFEGRPLMVLERLEGWTLRKMLVSRHALPWPEVIRYTIQIANALEAAHTRRPSVVHRDLKPENVIVEGDGRVKVMDFGIAKIVRTMTGTTDHTLGHAHGTLQYMSPEQIDASNVDGRADLFALGLLMWEMLAGRPPFAGKSPRVLLDQICHQPTPRLPDEVRVELPAQVEALIDRLLSKNPAGRPASASQVIIELESSGKLERPTQTATEAPAMLPPASDQTSPKGSLQHQVEQRFDDVADAVSRFGRATSALIVRLLIGLMILPAAAVVFVGIPILLVTTNLLLLAEQQEVMMYEADFQTWVRPELGAVLLVSAIVFVRACWIHHRSSSEPDTDGAPKSSGRGGTWLWLILGVIMFGAWAGVTAIEFAPDSNVPPLYHYATIASAAIWLALSLSWGTGRIVSLILRRLERHA